MDQRANTLPPQMSMSDFLCAVGRSGDPEAFEALFNYYAPRLKAYFRRLGFAESVAEDLVQDAMFTIWRKAQQFDPEKGDASSWIFKVARNLSIDTRRRDDRMKGGQTISLIDEVYDASSLVSDGRDVRESVRQAIGLLPEKQNEAITLFLFKNMTHAEIGKSLNVPLGTLKSRIRRGLIRLRQTLYED